MGRLGISLVALLGIGSTVLVFACGSDATCGDLHTCGGADADGGDGSAESGANPSDANGVVEGSASDGGIDAPAGCDLTKDPKDSLPCVDDSVGVFVDASSGSDANPGTKASPFKSITKALAVNAGAKPRVYVCAGVYPENVVIDQAHAASIYGAFDCGTWGTDVPSSPSQVQPTSGVALKIAAVTGAVGVQISARRACGDGPGREQHRGVRERVAERDDEAGDAEGGRGARRREPERGRGGSAPVVNADGGDAERQRGRRDQRRSGADVHVREQPHEQGRQGRRRGQRRSERGCLASDLITQQVTPVPAVPSCDCSGTSTGGRIGSDAPSQSAATSITVLGALTASGWAPQSAARAARTGRRGRAEAEAEARAEAAEAAGAADAAGARGSAAAEAARASRCSRSTRPSRWSRVFCNHRPQATEETGGAGGPAQSVPAAFGNKGAQGGAACSGGNGGAGGAGGAGGGGAGGISAGVLYKGTKPTYGADTTVTTGALGTKGTGGVPATNDGIDGQKSDALTAP